MADLQRMIALGLATVIAAVILIGLYISASPSPAGKGFVITLASSGQTLISDQDVTYYNATSRELGLTTDCLARLKDMDLYHKAFNVMLDGRFLSNGSFWSEVDSMTPPTGITTFDAVLLRNGHSSSVWMEACYPSGYYINCTTPAFFDDIAAHFQGIGKLLG
jgi:hypothetical protein